MGQALALLENLKLIYFPSYCGHKLHRSHYLTRSLQLCVSLSHRLSLFVYGAPSRPLSLPVSPSHSLSLRNLYRFLLLILTLPFPLFQSSPTSSQCVCLLICLSFPVSLSLSLSLSLHESTDCSVAQSTNYAALTSPLSRSRRERSKLACQKCGEKLFNSIINAQARQTAIHMRLARTPLPLCLASSSPHWGNSNCSSDLASICLQFGSLHFRLICLPNSRVGGIVIVSVVNAICGGVD